jgi:hypothetical protein
MLQPNIDILEISNRLLNKPNQIGYWFLYDDINKEWDVVSVTEDLNHYYTIGDDWQCSIALRNNCWVKIVMPNFTPDNIKPLHENLQDKLEYGINGDKIAKDKINR